MRIYLAIFLNRDAFVLHAIRQRQFFLSLITSL